MIMITGGCGYIGSHTCIALHEASYDFLIVDDFSTSRPDVAKRISRITGKDIQLEHLDVGNKADLRRVFAHNAIDAVIHFAGSKSVSESVTNPLRYYENNVANTISLLSVMEEFNVANFIFSSSATVYGDGNSVPYDESATTKATNPYGRSKLTIEQLLEDLCNTPDSDFNATTLRYFNPIGAHSSGLIGEEPNGIPNNLLPLMSKVAAGELPELSIFGDDYPTRDGTGIRDFIHVMDLAEGHVKAVQKLTSQKGGYKVYNLGTGKGHTVLEVLQTYEMVASVNVPYRIANRRPGDVAVSYANCDKAHSELEWRPQYDLVRMIEDAHRWKRNNPRGDEAES